MSPRNSSQGSKSRNSKKSQDNSIKDSSSDHKPKSSHSSKDHEILSQAIKNQGPREEESDKEPHSAIESKSSKHKHPHSTRMELNSFGTLTLEPNVPALTLSFSLRILKTI